MGADSKIEWTDATWNPMRGCTRVSEGCRNCYAETVAARFSGPGQPYHGFADRTRSGSKWTGKVEIAWSVIEAPLQWRRPRRIFVNSMSDFFHPTLPAEELATVYATAIAAHHLRGHTLQILTKRPDRAAELMNSGAWWDQVNAEAGALVMEHCSPHDRRSDDARATLDDYSAEKPPPGIWLGTSIEDQAAADERIPHLLRTPAAVRFLSCEPLLGPVDLGGWLPGETGCQGCDDGEGFATHRCLRSDIPREEQCPEQRAVLACIEHGPRDADGAPAAITMRRLTIDWVIAGGESGPAARPTHPEWVRGLRDQCADAGAPFFFKQWGEWLPHTQDGADVISYGGDPKHRWDQELHSYRVGKKRAGALLDGVEHRAFPDA